MTDTVSSSLNKRTAGFTLVELMVALAIFAVGMLGVSAMFTTSIGANAQGKHMTEATMLAQSRLDHLQGSVPYVNLDTYAGTVTKLDSAADAENNLGTGQQIYTRVTEITSPVSGLDIRKIKVTVSWVSKPVSGYDAKPVTRSVTLSTIRANGL